MKETSLSGKIQHKAGVELSGGPFIKSYIEEEDVREAVLRLKDKAKWNMSGIVGISITGELSDLIDEIFGDKLTESEGRGL